MSPQADKTQHGAHATNGGGGQARRTGGAWSQDSSQTRRVPAVGQTYGQTSSNAAQGSWNDAAKRTSRPDSGATSRIPPVSNDDGLGFVPTTPMGGSGRGRAGKAMGIVLGVVAVILVIVYIGGAVYFGDHFLPNTKLGQLDVSLMSSDQAQDAVTNEISDYSLTLSGDGFEATYSSTDIGLALDSAEVVFDALGRENRWAWPIEILGDHDVSSALVATHNKDELNKKLTAAIEEFNASADDPVNATIAYDEEGQAFEIVPEQEGTTLNADAVLSAVDEAIIAFETELVLGDDQLNHPTLFSDDERLVSAKDKATKMAQAGFSLQVGDTVVASGDADLIASWIGLDDNVELTLSDDAVAAWGAEVTAGCNTVGTTRTYTRPDGKVITVSGGDYGWSVDTSGLTDQVKEIVLAGEGGTVSLSYSQTAAQLVAAGEQDWGNRYVDVDLAEQHVRFYDGGNLVWEADCVSGTPNGKDDTSVGVYYIENKESPSKLIGYENGEKIYESEVQYWMPFDRNMVGLHDASWQSAFGGTRYKDGYGSHGCVNLPTDSAAQLYSLVQIGDPVVSHW